MPFDWSEYESDSATEEVALLVSVKSQSLILSAMQSLQFRSNWLEIDDATYDDIEAAVAEAYEEIMRVSMPDFTPVGAIMAYPDEALPDKWLLCNGDFVLQSTYPELYAICGSKFGTPAAGRFYLPDLVARFIHGASDNTGIGFEGGAETHTLTESEMPAHTHTVQRANNIGNAAPNVVEADSTVASTPFSNTGSTGGGAAHNNMPPYLRLIYMIKALP